MSSLILEVLSAVVTIQFDIVTLCDIVTMRIRWYVSRSYWITMIVNDGHYIYRMLNEYGPFTYYTTY